MINLVERYNKIPISYFSVLHDQRCPADNVGAYKVLQNTKNL